MFMVVILALSTFHAAGSSTSNSSCNHSNPCPLIGGSALRRCPEFISKDGFLDIVITVEIGYFQFEWLQIPRRSYNGSKCPPTLRIKPGDTINLTLVNNLEDGTHVDGANHALNITNLHTHGLHISSREPQDYVFLEIKPGESYQHSYNILDYHAPGTHWYHTHHHGSTTIQTVGGMAGMIIIEDDPTKMVSELRAVSCPENCVYDIPLMVSPMLVMPIILYDQISFGDSLRLPHDLEDWLRANVNNFTVNGEFKPQITLQKNQLTRFRILNVGHAAPLELLIVDDQDRPAPCDFREIARDGVYFDKPTVPKKGQSVLHPGNRLDWLIKCTTIGKFKLFSHAKPQNAVSFGGGDRRTRVIATIDVTDRNNSRPILDFPKKLPTRPEEYLPDLRNVKPDRYITVEIGGNNELNREVYSVPTNYRFKVEVDSIVEIQMISADYSFAHPMHFHVNHMQVIRFEPYTGPVAYYKYLNPTWEFRDFDGSICYHQHRKYVEGAVSEQFNISHPLKFKGHYDRWVNNTYDSLAYDIAGQWVDNVFSPGLSNITLRMKTHRFTGPLLIHCHMPEDADRGMMMVIEIVEKGADLSGANILSGTAAPGSCRKCDWNRFMETPPDCASSCDARRCSWIQLWALLVMVLATLNMA